MANKIQIRKDTASRWADVNPVLSQGELGLDTTVGKIKIGNGVSSWSSLSFYTGNPNTLINGSHTVTLGTDGNITLPVGGLIKNSDGTNYNNTGNLSFRNDTVYNLNGINVENSNLTHTATSSVILPANGTGDNLQLNNTYGNVDIVAGSGGQSLKSWLFGSDGRLSLPSNLTGDSVLYSDTSNIQLVSNSNTWSFKTDGTLSVPTLSIDIHNGGIQSAQVLKFSDPSKQVIITGPTPASGSSAQRIIIQGQRGTGNGEGGDVYVWGGDSDINGGDIKIYAGDADSTTSGLGGYINIDAGNGYDAGGALTLSAGNSSQTGGNIVITAGTGGITHGSVQINLANNRHWTFNSSGDLVLPPTPSSGVTNADQVVSTRIYRETTSNDASAIDTAKSIWESAEQSWVDVRNIDEQINGYNRPWHNMPSWQAYSLILSYTAPQGESPVQYNLPALANSAKNAYFTFKQLESNIDIVTGNKIFSFENTGNLSLPNGSKLVTSITNSVFLYNNGESRIGITNQEPTIRAGSEIWSFWTNGTTQFAGGWKFNNQYGSTEFPNNRLLAPSNTNLDIKVTNTDANPVLSLTNTTKTWTFDKDGKFNLPNSANITKSTNTELTIASSIYDAACVNWVTFTTQETLNAAAIGITPEGWPWLNWRVTGTNVDSYLTELTTAWNIQQAPSSPPTTLVFTPAISQNMYTQIRNALLLIQSTFATVTTLSTSVDIVAGLTKLSLLGNGKLVVPDIIENVPEENLILRTRYAVASSPPGVTQYSNKDWIFGTNGTLTFPDTTVQSTAYVSNITNTAANGSLYLTPTSVMTRGARLEVRTVYTSPNSLNMEFRYQGLGDQIAITANNGTNLFSGASIGYGTIWTRFNPAVFVNPGEKAEVVICDHSYHKIYRVTAIMRDVPSDNDGSGSVYCTIEELK